MYFNIEDMFHSLCPCLLLAIGIIYYMLKKKKRQNQSIIFSPKIHLNNE